MDLIVSYAFQAAMSVAPKFDDLDRRFLRWLLILVMTGALILFLWRISSLLLLMLASMVLAVVLHAIADPLVSRWRVPPAVALAVAVLVMLALTGVTGWLIEDQLASQADSMSRAIADGLDNLRDWLATIPIGRPVLQALDASPQGAKVLTRLFHLALATGNVILDFIVVTVGALFFAAQPELYRNGFLKLAPQPLRPALREALDDSGRALKLWVVTILVAMVAVGTMVGLGLWMIGIPSAAALGLIAGLSEFAPYVGPTLAMIPAMLLAINHGGWPEVGLVVAIYFVVRMLQANLVTPIVQSRVVRVPPAMTLFAIIGAGVAFGPLGLAIGGPVNVLAYVLVKRLWVRDTLGEPGAVPK